MANTIIVVPCHNEAQRLKTDKFHQFAADHTEIQFLMVNDGSRDNTLELLDQLATARPMQFEVLHLAQNSGKAEAVRRGILQAAGQRPDYIGFWDADLATPLEAIVQFKAALDRRPEIQLLLGVRMPLLGHAIRRRPLRRRLGQLFARTASFALGTRFHDTQCGAKLFRTRPEILAAFSQPFHSHWIFDVELLARFIRLQRETEQATVNEMIYEFPLEQWEDVAGSKLKRGDFFKAVAELSGIWWRYLRPAAPEFIAAPMTADVLPEQPATQIRRAA